METRGSRFFSVEAESEIRTNLGRRGQPNTVDSYEKGVEPDDMSSKRSHGGSER